MKFRVSRSTSNQIIAVFFAKSCHLTTTPLQKRKRVNAELYINICLPKVFEAWTARRPNKQSRSGELRTQKLKSHLLRTQSSKVLILKPGVGPYMAIYATHTARDFFLAYFYPSGPFTCIFSKTSPDFSLCWLWLTLVPV